ALAGEFAGLVVEVVLGHPEEGEPLRAGATDALDPFGAGEHQVHDVLGHVVGGGGDEALHAGDVPGTVGVRGRLRATGAHIGAGVGLGEHHGAAPLALHHDL